jgi:hypothetical protein
VLLVACCAIAMISPLSRGQARRADCDAGISRGADQRESHADDGPQPPWQGGEGFDHVDVGKLNPAIVLAARRGEDAVAVQALMFEGEVALKVVERKLVELSESMNSGTWDSTASGSSAASSSSPSRGCRWKSYPTRQSAVDRVHDPAPAD